LREMSRKETLFVILLIYILLASFTEGCLGLMIKMTSADLWCNADVVLIGDVTSITTHEGNGGMIYKNVNVKVKRCFKGSLNSSEVVIHVLGGEIGEMGVWVEDQPSFHRGERVLVYLREHSEGSFYGIEGYYVVGGPQGKFTISFGIAKNEVGDALMLTDLFNFTMSIEMKIASGAVLVGAISLIIYLKRFR